MPTYIRHCDEGIRSGAFLSRTVDTYASNFKGTPAADDSSRKRAIDVVDITDTAAMVKATLVRARRHARKAPLSLALARKR